MQTTTLEVRGLFEELDHLGVEKQLSQTPGVSRAIASPASESVTVDFDERLVTADRLQGLITNCGFHCRGRPVPRHVCAIHSAILEEEGHDHGHAAPEADRSAPSEPPMHDAMAHEMGHGAGMDMAAMARDMRNRFFVSLVFTVPIFAMAPMGMARPLIVPPAVLGLDLTLFLLASAAILYPAWPFVVAAIRALRNGILNMAVLVLLSVGTGYLFSVGSTFLFEGRAVLRGLGCPPGLHPAWALA